MTSVLARLRPARDPRAPAAGTRGRLSGYDRPWVSGAVAGLGAAAAGLLVLAALIGLAWILEPAIGGSVLGPARLAAQTWVLAHGGDVMTDGVIVGLTPLGLTALVSLCCWYAGAWAGRRSTPSSLREVTESVFGLVLAYAAVGVGISLIGSTAGAAIRIAASVPWVCLVCALAATGGALRAAGHGRLMHDRLPFPSRALLAGIGVGAAVLMAAGVTAVGVAVAVDRAGFATLTESLAPGWSAGLGLFVLTLLLLPNAALYAVAVLVGPGFAVGTETTVSAFGVSLGQVPGLPLVAALPDQPAVPLGALVGLVVPVLCGLAMGAALARRLEDTTDANGRDIGSLRAAGWAATAGLTLAAGLGVAQWLAGGALGDGALATIGAPPLATAAAAVGSMALPAALSAALQRRHVLRHR